jgi:hypothetical protein
MWCLLWGWASGQGDATVCHTQVEYVRLSHPTAVVTICASTKDYFHAQHLKPYTAQAPCGSIVHLIAGCFQKKFLSVGAPRGMAGCGLVVQLPVAVIVVLRYYPMSIRTSASAVLHDVACMMPVCRCAFVLHGSTGVQLSGASGPRGLSSGLRFHWKLSRLKCCNCCTRASHAPERL